MPLFKSLLSSKLIEILKNDGVGILPTDTLYGLVGKALSDKAVRKIYNLKKRDSKKPSIVLISDTDDLGLFKVKFGKREEFLTKYWPGKISVVLPCPFDEFDQIHRGGNTIAFRVPKHEKLRALLEWTGPLMAPSANPEEQEPAKTISKARDYFGDKVDFYVDQGKKVSKPSTLIKFENNSIKVLRKGAVEI